MTREDVWKPLSPYREECLYNEMREYLIKRREEHLRAFEHTQPTIGATSIKGCKDVGGDWGD